ncbi:MAG: hypothetical protein U5K69_20570 [Balneolaceae bacterium]|nr:hypothetical protein [Balneolaceae bacterium]
MQHKITSLLFIACTAFFMACGGGSSEEQQAQQINTDQFSFAENNGSITLPSGFQAIVVADSVGSARQVTVDQDGDIYVALDEPQNGNGIAALRDEDGDGVADSVAYFGDYTGTGIALHNGYLYFAPDSAVMRYSMNGADLVPTSEPEWVVSELPIQNSHAAKPITFDGNGNMYVNVGAPSNACQEQSRTPESPGQRPCPLLEWHGGIWQFDANGMNQTQKRRWYTLCHWNPKCSCTGVEFHGRQSVPGPAWSRSTVAALALPL